MTPPSFVHLHLHSTLQSDIKPDDLLLKGSKTKEKSKDKKSSKDKKKGQAVDGAEKRPVKAKVDEMVVSVSITLSLKVTSTQMFTDLQSSVFVDLHRSLTRSWRLSTATLRTGFTLSTSTEGKPAMTTNTRWMMTELLGDSRWNDTE